MRTLFTTRSMYSLSGEWEVPVTRNDGTHTANRPSGQTSCLLPQEMFARSNLWLGFSPEDWASSYSFAASSGRTLSMQRPLALSDEQLDQVYRTAGTVPVHLRDTFLERLADLLSGKPLGDGFVYRCCREASYGLVEYAYEEAPAPADRVFGRMAYCPGENRHFLPPNGIVRASTGESALCAHDA
jgi:hypothetical protein